jgi:outer membrane protein assembly factor BamB
MVSNRSRSVTQRMKPLFKIALLAVCLVPLFTCKRNETIVDPGPNPNAQGNISWPGLANSPWPMYSHDPQHTSRSSFRGPQQGVVEWLFNASNSVYSSPAIDEMGMIYFEALNHAAFAVTASGSQTWSVPGGGGDSSPLLDYDGSVYFYGIAGPLSFGLYSYDRSGKLNWQYTIAVVKSFTSPSISMDGKTLYLAADTVFAVRRTGQVRWKTILPDNDLAHYALAISPDGATLFVPGYNGIYAVDTSGTFKWKYSLPVTPSDPAVDNQGNVYFAMGTKLYSLDPNGVVRWVYDGIDRINEDTGPAIGIDGTLYTTGAALYAIDKSGGLKWAYTLPAPYSQCIPAIDVDGTIYFGRNTTRTSADSINFLAVNPNGTLKFQMCLRSPDGTVPDIDSHPSITGDGKIYVGSDRPHGVHVYKIR